MFRFTILKKKMKGIVTGIPLMAILLPVNHLGCIQPCAEAENGKNLPVRPIKWLPTHHQFVYRIYILFFFGNIYFLTIYIYIFTTYIIYIYIYIYIYICKFLKFLGIKSCPLPAWTASTIVKKQATNNQLSISWNSVPLLEEDHTIRGLTL